MVKLNEYDYIGFDLDHTVVQYQLSNLYTLIYDSLVLFLVSEKGYDCSLLDTRLDDNKDFILRGLILDFEKGNFLKLDKHGCILRASHGTKPLTREEIIECYGEKGYYKFFSDIKLSMIKRHRLIVNFRKFETFFDLPGSLVAANIIDRIDAKNGKSSPDYKQVWLDVLDGMILNFSPSSFVAKKGNYFPKISESPNKYIKKCSLKLINWIKSLRREERKVFLLTNSFIDYASFLMEYAVGSNWRDLFDIVLCRANKPGFFVPYESGDIIPFYEVDGMTEAGEAKELHLNKIYSQGNIEMLRKHLISWSGNDDPRVLFFGDSVKSDIYPTHILAKWDVVAVLEEMEVEGMVTKCHIQQEDGPKRKRPKLMELTFEEGKDEVLLSDRWGSMFTDNILANGMTRPHHDVVVRTEEHFYHEVDTFWGDLIRECSTIAIPTIDFITDILQDHEFETFNDSSFGGFYPGLPKSLLID